ncbi:hypothetical protein [Photobacterium rosenbergii]|nr:hypothetical protein [Photobacterium rosenbergii]
MIKNTQPLCLALVIAATLTACDEESTSDARMYVPYNLDSVTYPNDILLTDDDGTIEMKVETSGEEVDYRNYENVYGALDGWSTGYPIIIPLMGPEHDVDPTSLASSVIIFNAEEGSELVYDKDFTAEINEDGDLTILPMTVLSGSTTYVLALTDGLKNSAGESVLKASINYQKLEDGDDLGHLLGNEASSQIQNNHNLVADAAGGQNIVYSAQFTTQSIYPVMDEVVKNIDPNIELKIPSPLSSQTGDSKARKLIKASLTVPYYLEMPQADTCIVPELYNDVTTDAVTQEIIKTIEANKVASCPELYSWWKGANGEFVTRDNPTPVATTTQDVEVDIYAPGDWDGEEQLPAVIFVHGITGHKGNAGLMANKIVADGRLVIAIDNPLHGDRGVNLDDDAEPEITATDGEINQDKASYLNLLSPLTLRDNQRQAVADQLALRKALNNADFVNKDDISLVGQSLGGIIATMVSDMSQHYPDDLKFKTVSLVVPGMHLTDLVMNSPFLGEEVEGEIRNSTDIQLAVAGMVGVYDSEVQTKVEGLNALAGFKAESGENAEKATGIEDMVFDMVASEMYPAVQVAVDSGDPANFIQRQRDNTQQPLLMIEAAGTCDPYILGDCVVEGGDNYDYIPDEVVVNYVPGKPLVGTEPLIEHLKLSAISEGTSDTEEGEVIRGVVRAMHGGHGTYLFPYEGPAVCVETNPEGICEQFRPMGEKDEGFGDYFVEISKSTGMQQDAVVSFINSGGTSVTVEGSPVH